MGDAAAAAPALDLPLLAARFGRALHAAGVPSTPERAARFAAAVGLEVPRTRERLYWTARVTFVSAREQLPAFDRVFAAVFGPAGPGPDPADRRGDPNAPPLEALDPSRRSVPAAAPAAAAAGAVLPPVARGGEPTDGDDGAEREAILAAASADERLGERDFATLDPEELVALRQLMDELSLHPPLRRTRRARRRRRGEHVDVRATLRRSLRTGGDPVALARRRRRLRPRRVVLLCDISGSMEPYARAFLQFLHGAVTAGGHVEAFTFATRLTRVTPALRAPGGADAALARAAAAAPDWSGGTRIGEALRTFIDRHGRRGLARGAVVVVLSDGWERQEPEAVGREMARLRRLAHRIVWVNPRKASPAFAPLAGGMAAALPHCDAFLSGHSLSALRAVAEAIASDRPAPT